eukprot:8078563-Pyramimonas_sp.AAC.1
MDGRVRVALGCRSARQLSCSGSCLRAVDEELAGRLGVAHGHGVCDIAQCYDSVGWHRIAAAALRLDFPAEILGLELQQRMAVRCVRQSGAHGPPFCPTRSIVQGLRAGTRF